MDQDMEDHAHGTSVMETTEFDELTSEPSASMPYDVGAEPLADVVPNTVHAVAQAPGDAPTEHVLPGPTSSVLSQPAYTPSTIMVMVPPAKFEPLPYATSRSGLVYDARMRWHMDQRSDDDDAHPEKPGRILQIFAELIKAGLVVDPTDPYGSQSATQDPADFRLVRIPAREASIAEICLVHNFETVKMVQQTQALSRDEIEERSRQWESEHSIYWHNLSWLCATLSAGGAIEATRAVVAGQVKNAVAVIRPPGHHAEHDKPSGFCFFNNVPIAARVVQADFPDTCRKIIVLDWDVHHGNGTQQAFYNDPNVLYISLHVHQNGQFYPHGNYGDAYHCGAGPGLGRNVNIPWLHQGMTDADYILAFQQIVMPICIEFDPDLVMISAGFDAAADDPLGQCFVSPAGFAHMTHMLMQLAKGKVVACLEGGYNLIATAKSFLAMTRTLMGEPPERLGDMTPTPSAITVIHEVIRIQSPFWKCLYPKAINMRLKKELGSERLHDIIREWQSKVMWENYQMVSLFILRQQVSKSFQDQVLATQNYHEKRPLLVIFHDPPEALGLPNPQTRQLELHNTWLTDVPKTYVDWAVKHDFAVIDVNIPRHITAEDDDAELYMEPDSYDKRAALCRELAIYLWDNYIETSEKTHLFFIGIGQSHRSLTDLMKYCPMPDAPCLSEVDAIFGFVTERFAISRVFDPDDDSLGKEYYRKSMVFVTPEHPAFAEDAPKLKRKHGNVVKANADNLQEMLLLHRETVTDRLLEMTQDWRDSDGTKSSDSGFQTNAVEYMDLGNPETTSLPHINGQKHEDGNGRLMPPVGTFETTVSPRKRSPAINVDDGHGRRQRLSRSPGKF